MKRSMRRIMAVLLVVWLLMTMLPLSASAGTKKYDLSKCPVCGEKKVWDPFGSLCVEPTCTQKGRIEGYCGGKCYRTLDPDREGHVVYEVPALGHDWGKKTVIKESTCSVKGSYKHTCKRCGKTETEESDLKPHTWGEWTIVNEAADFSVGLREHTCEKCGKKRQEEYYPEGTLKSGDKGDAVKELQEKLNENGNDCGKADGVYGKKTAAAVTALESANGLEADGIAWPAVQALLYGGGIGGGGDTSVILTKSLLDEPDNGEYFTEGEWVKFSFVLYNESDETLNDVYILEPDTYGNGAILVEYTEELAPGESLEAEAIYEVTAEDVSAGAIVNVARGVWDDGSVWSNPAVVPIELGADPDGVVLHKMVSTMPEYEFFIPGEAVEYMITLTNLTDEPLRDVTITDRMASAEEEEVLCTAPEVAPGETVTIMYEYTMTAEDVNERGGEVVNTAYAVWNGGQAASEEVTTYVAWPETDDDDAVCEIVKDVISEPANGEFYVAGEEILYELTVYNYAGWASVDVQIYDPLLGGYDMPVGEGTLEPDGEMSVTIPYTVSEYQAADGEEITNTAFAECMVHPEPDFEDEWDIDWSEPVVVWSREVTVQTGIGTSEETGEDEEEPEEGETDDLYWIEKYVVDGPANKEYYVEGETVRYGVTVYNYAYWASASVTVCDPIFGDDERIIGEGSIEPNGAMDIIFPYTVTAEDVENGYISNRVYMEATPVVAEGYDPEEWEDRMGTQTIWSEWVTVQTGEGEPVKDGSVTLTKEIVNDPVNDDYFMETEEIEYRIVLKNGTEGTIWDVTITDPLKGGNEDAVVDYFESVGPGESAEATYIHKVTADEADQAEIRNTAYAGWIVPTEDPDVWDEGETRSEEVIAITGREVIEEPEPVEMDRKITDTAYVGEAYDRNFDLADYIDGNDFQEIRWVPEGSALYEIGLASYEDEERMIHIYGTPDSAGVVSNYYEYEIDGILFHVEIEITVLEEVDRDEGDEEFPLSISKECISTPWYTDGYIEGEAVEYRVTVSNSGDDDITGVTVTDPLAPEDYWPEVIPAGGSVKFEYIYYVTDWDAEQGSIENIAELYWLTDEEHGIGLSSDPVVVETQILTPPEPDDDPIPKTAREFSIEKELDGEPKNGSFYTPGEKVKYKLIVRNDTDQTYEDAWVGDSLEKESPWFKELGTLEPGYYLEIPYEYEVKEEDLGANILINIGMLTGVDEAGLPQEVWSGRVIVEIGPGLIPPVTGENTPAPGNTPKPQDTPKPPEKEELHPSLTITKEAKSEPDNGSYYTEGEKIEYEITYKNTGDIDLSETVIWDILDTTEPIGKVPYLKTGEEKKVKYEYTVQAGDIGTWVVNVAFAEYKANGVINVAMSNEVKSPTGEDPEPPEKKIGPMGQKEEPCSRTITENGEDYGIYEVHYCEEHGPTEDAVKMLTEAADTPEAEQKAWEYAAGLWKKDIDVMYDAMTKAASGPAKAVVFRERLLFYAQAASRGSLLSALYPEEPERAAREIAEMYMNKCVDLCYELSTAPGARADDPAGAVKSGWSGDTAAECTHMILSDTGRDVEYQESYCASHTTTHQLSNALLEGSADPEASWKQIGALWEMELEKGYAVLTASPEEELSTIAAADRKLYGEWLEAREEYLRILYAGEDAIVEQMLAKAMTDRVTENCELDTGK